MALILAYDRIESCKVTGKTVKASEWDMRVNKAPEMPLQAKKIDDNRWQRKTESRLMVAIETWRLIEAA